MFKYRGYSCEFSVNQKEDCRSVLLIMKDSNGSETSVLLGAKLDIQPNNKDGFWLPVSDKNENHKVFLFLKEEDLIKKRQFSTVDEKGEKYLEYFITEKGMEHTKELV